MAERSTRSSPFQSYPQGVWLSVEFVLYHFSQVSSQSVVGWVVVPHPTTRGKVVRAAFFYGVCMECMFFTRFQDSNYSWHSSSHTSRWILKRYSSMELFHSHGIIQPPPPPQPQPLLNCRSRRDTTDNRVQPRSRMYSGELNSQHLALQPET